MAEDPMPDQKTDIRFTNAVAILPVPDVTAAVDHYHRILGFNVDFLWQNPPTHAGVSREKAGVQFTLNPARAIKCQTELFFFVEGLDDLYATHRHSGAHIVSSIENKPWGMREYTVRDLWGHELRFTGPEAYMRPTDARATLPLNIRIVERMPTLDEYLTLTTAVGWTADANLASRALQNSLWGVVAIDESADPDPTAVGALRIVGDGVRFCSFQDVMVLPAWQGKHIGSALIETALAYLRRTAPPGMFVSLFTTKPKFYERLGFQSGGGMHLKN
jgi:GNAT superfamily N-acetyltransferase